MKQVKLKNGEPLYWRENPSGGRSYYLRDSGEECLVWNTCNVKDDTLMAAVHKELELSLKDKQEELAKSLRSHE